MCALYVAYMLSVPHKSSQSRCSTSQNRTPPPDVWVGPTIYRYICSYYVLTRHLNHTKLPKCAKPPDKSWESYSFSVLICLTFYVLIYILVFEKIQLSESRQIRNSSITINTDLHICTKVGGRCSRNHKSVQILSGEIITVFNVLNFYFYFRNSRILTY